MNLTEKKLYGMLHLAGTYPVAQAIQDAQVLAECGFTGVIVENYHGSFKNVENTLEELNKLNLPLEIGVNILPNEYTIALETAHKHGAHFIQLDHVSGQYVRNSNTEKFIELDHLDYATERAKYPNIKVMGGVWPKYYTPKCHKEEFHLQRKQFTKDLRKGIDNADYIVVTGKGTGIAVEKNKVQMFNHDINLISSHGDDHLKRPLIIGAGMEVENVDMLFYAKGAIIGSSLKPDKNTMLPISKELVVKFITALNDEPSINYYRHRSR